MESKPLDSAESDRAAIIYELSRQVVDSAAHRSFGEALHTLALQTRLAIGAHQSAISYIPAGEFQRAIHAVSLSDKYAKYREYDVMPTGQGIWSVVVRQKQALCLSSEELTAHPMWANFSNLKDARGLEHPPMRGWLAAPVVRASGEVLGFLQFSDKFDDAEFNPADLDLLVRLASMVLPTFELHFVNEQLRQSRDELESRVAERTSELRERIARSESEIAERTKAEAALRESEQRFRTLVEHAPEAIVVLDADRGVFIDVNENACRLFDMPREELLRHGPLDLSPQVQADGIPSAEHGQRRIEATLAGEAMQFEWIHRDRSGREIPCEIYLVRLPAAGRRIIRGSIVDITERKRAELAIRASEQRFRDLFENSPDAIFVEDLDGWVLDANSAACRLHRCERQNLVGKHIRDLVPPAKVDETLEQFRRLSRGEISLLESVSYTADGQAVPVEIRSSPIQQIGRPRLLLQVRDISDRKRAEESLRVSEALFRGVVEGSLQGIVIHQDSIIRFANPAYVRMFGYESEAELLGRNLWDTMIAPEDHDGLKDRTAAFYRGESPPPLPAWHGVRKDGTRFWVAGTASLIEWNGQPAIAAFLLDVDERKLAEEKVRVSEAHFRSVVEGSLHAILIFQDDRVRFANPAALRMFGYDTTEELMDRDLLATLLAPEAWPIIRERIARSFQGVRQQPSQPFQCVRRNGSRFWGISVSSLLQWNGRPALVVFLLDVDDRKRAEDANEASRRMLQIVLDYIPQGVFWKDRNSVYLGCNRVVARAFGFEHPDQIVGRTDYQLPGLALDQAEFFIRKDRDVMEGNAPEFGILERATLADGRTIWMETTKIPMRDGSGNAVGVLGTWQDVTEKQRLAEERQRLEAQLQHTQKLESLGILAGGIAHDFNNLLTSILGYADLAQQELPRGSAARDHITSAVDGARRAAELTNQMLAYSGKGRFVVEALDLSQIVEDLTRLLQITISKKCVMKFNLMANLPSVEADAAQLRQIIMNLIINASEAIGDRSGVIAVTTGIMNCDRSYLAETYLDDNLTPGQYVFLEVADTGCGMSEELRSRIFDPFFTTKFTGRGLGLSAVLGIVRGHRGAIKCYSEVDRGTTFKVLFPAVDHPAHSAAAAPPAGDAWKGTGTVLVVDDEESIRTLAQRMLETMGFEVLTAKDGVEGVEIFRRDGDRIRFVLLDMTMPRLDGEETFREMRRIRPDVRAILSSGYNEQTATSRFAGKGLAAFVQKPYGFVDLRNLVRRVLGE